jgi:hypothetical protein
MGELCRDLLQEALVNEEAYRPQALEACRQALERGDIPAGYGPEGDDEIPRNEAFQVGAFLHEDHPFQAVEEDLQRGAGRTEERSLLHEPKAPDRRSHPLILFNGLPVVEPKQTKPPGRARLEIRPFCLVSF